MTTPDVEQIYWDNNATTAPAPEVVEEMMDALQRAWGNPSSIHHPGQAARSMLSDARARVSQFLGCQSAELIFTSGATEANHQAVLGALSCRREEGGVLRNRLVLSCVEHPGLLALGARLKAQGTPVDLIPVDNAGALDMHAAQSLMGPDVALVSVMAANNETGVLMPVRQLVEMAHAVGAWLHVDATQLVGKSTWRFDASGVDMCSVSAHKLHGPKGSGALILRKGIHLPALIEGRQERKRRGGTENLPGIVGFAAAADLTASSLNEDLLRMAALRDQLETSLAATWPEQVHIYSRGVPRLPNTSCLRFGDLDAELVLNRLERSGVIASSGAACSAGGTQPSHVLMAMGVGPEHAKACIRFSLDRETSPRQLEIALTQITTALTPLLGEGALVRSRVQMAA